MEDYRVVILSLSTEHEAISSWNWSWSMNSSSAHAHVPAKTCSVLRAQARSSSVGDGELLREHCFVARVGEDDRLVRALGERAEIEVLAQRCTGVEKSARLGGLAAQNALCVIELDRQLRPDAAIARADDIEVERRIALVVARRTRILERHAPLARRSDVRD